MGKGDQYEDQVAEMLLAKGYTLLTRRFRARGGEIDIVALDGETLVFVEVKYRASGHPETAVGSTKIARCAAAAEAYLQKTGEHRRHTRFDLVAITEGEVRHYPGAFRAP
ncbi:MAG: YraN family protein [Fimbriimonadaceae bacterium]